MYDFRCTCPACDVLNPFAQESEARRLEMRDLEGWISTYRSAPLRAPMMQDGLVPAFLRLISLVKEEGLHGELMCPYRDLAEHLKAQSDFSEALVYARLELEEEVICLGEGSEVVQSTRSYINDLEMAIQKEGVGKGEETGEGG